jgi:cell division protein FtsZ
MEVSEASGIIQEAAHEEANIIFGAVVDPAMNGRVKITVIATGFDRQAASTVSASATQTPVDLQSYAAWRQEVGERTAVGGGSLMGFSRRTILDRPIVAPLVESEADDMGVPDAELEAVSPLDVPAFMRRQSEG